MSTKVGLLLLSLHPQVDYSQLSEETLNTGTVCVGEVRVRVSLSRVRCLAQVDLSAGIV